jgi:KDO2-lipid IV(A) lauroyltransferase
LLPRSLQLIISPVISKSISIFLKKRNRISKKNIDACFHNLDDIKRRSLIKSNINNSGLVMFDTAISWFWSDARINKEIKYKIRGLEQLKNEQKKGNGVLLFFKHSLHLELDARILGMNADIYGVERTHNSKLFDAIQSKGRLKGVKGLCDKNKPLKFIKWLLSGKTVLYATDQDYGMNGSEVVNFFNLPAATISAPYKIIRKTNCQTYFLNSFIVNDEYIIEIEKIELNMNSDKEMSSDLNKIIENSIRKHPSEYLWQHRRFKSTLGKEKFYK